MTGMVKIFSGPIEQFNPYSMADDDITYLATGREAELSTILNTVEGNRKNYDSNQHLMIVGPRGMGKSFLIQLLKVNISQTFPELIVVQLPEEQSNIKGPAAFLDVITQAITKTPRQRQFAQFGQEKSEAWDGALKSLRQVMNKHKKNAPNLQVVVTVENFDILLERCFKVKADESKFRAMLVEEYGLMFVTSTLRGELDLEANNRLFHAFNHIRLKPWDDDQLEDYFHKRRQSENTPPEMKARYQAVAQFVGGSPRMAVILNDLIDTLEDPISSAKLLDRFTDQLTPYYQDLMRLMPPNSEALFDALIRGGEQCSQSELAQRVGATQSRIAQSFSWLQDKEIVFGEREIGGKSLLYRVADRLFVQYFRKRYIHFDSWDTPLMAIAELLEKLYTAEEKLKMARSYYKELGTAEGDVMGMLYLNARGVAMDGFSTDPKAKSDLIRIMADNKTFSIDDYDSEEDAYKDLDKLYKALSATTRKDEVGTFTTTGKKLADLVHKSTTLSYEEKMSICHAAIHSLDVLRIDVITFLLGIEDKHGDLDSSSFFKRTLSETLKFKLDFSVSDCDKDEEALEPFDPEVMANVHHLLGWFAWNRQNIEKAIVHLSKSVEIITSQDTNDWNRAVSIGLLAAALLVNNQSTKAWRIIKKELHINSANSVSLFKFLADAIYFEEKHHGRAAGFAVAKKIAVWLSKQRAPELFKDAVQGLVIRMFEMGNSYQLMGDIILEIVAYASKHKEIALIAEASEIALHYAKMDCDDNVIQKIDPDMQTLVKRLTKDLRKERMDDASVTKA